MIMLVVNYNYERVTVYFSFISVVDIFVYILSRQNIVVSVQFSKLIMDNVTMKVNNSIQSWTSDNLIRCYEPFNERELIFDTFNC